MSFRRKRRYKKWPMRYGGYGQRFGGSRGGMLRPEKKFFDTKLASTAISVNGTTMQGATNSELTAIINGTGENQRTGSRIRLKSIHGRVRIVQQSETVKTTVYNQVRIVIGIDKQANGAHAAFTDLLEANTLHEFRNIENIHRFIFLYDKTFSFGSSGIGGGSSTVFMSVDQQKFININLRLNMPMYFDGATGQKAEVRSHQIFMYAVSLRAGATMINSWRIRYYG